MEKNIYGLSNDVYEIAKCVDNVTMFNDEIKKHINELKDSGKNVETYTKDALLINQQDMDKTIKTREMMNNILVVADKLEELFYENQGF